MELPFTKDCEQTRILDIVNQLKSTCLCLLWSECMIHLHFPITIRQNIVGVWMGNSIETTNTWEFWRTANIILIRNLYSKIWKCWRPKICLMSNNWSCGISSLKTMNFPTASNPCLCVITNYIRWKPTATIRLCSICILRLLLVPVMCQDTVFKLYYSGFQNTLRVKCAPTVSGILLLLSCLIYLAHIRMSALMTGMSQLYLYGLHFKHHWGQHRLLQLPISPSAKCSLLTSLSNFGKNPCINTVDVLVSIFFSREYDCVSKYSFPP